ncbi:hypothetical protein CBS101457_005128 [Exobasidium rhododendri]|nr:hypothetical protein CBS101457_005128 [Exobasidium rhododendri]
MSAPIKTHNRPILRVDKNKRTLIIDRSNTSMSSPGLHSTASHTSAGGRSASSDDIGKGSTHTGVEPRQRQRATSVRGQHVHFPFARNTTSREDMFLQRNLKSQSHNRVVPLHLSSPHPSPLKQLQNESPGLDVKNGRHITQAVAEWYIDDDVAAHSRQKCTTYEMSSNDSLSIGSPSYASNDSSSSFNNSDHSSWMHSPLFDVLCSAQGARSPHQKTHLPLSPPLMIRTKTEDYTAQRQQQLTKITQEPYKWSNSNLQTWEAKLDSPSSEYSADSVEIIDGANRYHGGDHKAATRAIATMPSRTPPPLINDTESYWSVDSDQSPASDDDGEGLHKIFSRLSIRRRKDSTSELRSRGSMPSMRRTPALYPPPASMSHTAYPPKYSQHAFTMRASPGRASLPSIDEAPTQLRSILRART